MIIEHDIFKALEITGYNYKLLTDNNLKYYLIFHVSEKIIWDKFLSNLIYLKLKEYNLDQVFKITEYEDWESDDDRYYSAKLHYKILKNESK